jgi:hypothetical protein
MQHPFILTNVPIHRQRTTACSIPPVPSSPPPPSPSRLTSQDSVSSHTTSASTALQSYDPRSQITNQTLEPRHHHSEKRDSHPHKREKEFNKSDPIFEHEEYHEKSRAIQGSIRGSPSQSREIGQKSMGRLLPPKVSREPDLMVEQKRPSSQQRQSPRPTPHTERFSNQLEPPPYVRTSSDSVASLVAHSVAQLPTQRQLDFSARCQISPATLRHSHDGVISRTRHPHHQLFQQQSQRSQYDNVSHSNRSPYSSTTSFPQHQSSEVRRHHTYAGGMYPTSANGGSRSKDELNQSIDSYLQYGFSSSDSVNRSTNLSLSLSSIGSSQRYQDHQPVPSTPTRSIDRSTSNPLSHHPHHSRTPTRSSQRHFSSSSSSTISSLSPQSPTDQYTSSRASALAPVLWTERTTKRSSPGHGSRTTPLALSFCYCSPQGDVLAISSVGDVVYCTYLPDRHGQLKPCRLCVRAAKPLVLSIGKVNHDMCQSIKLLTSLYGPHSTHTTSSSHTSMLQQEGIYGSASSGMSGVSAIFEDILWIKQYKVNQLEGRLQRVYHRVYEMIQMTKKKRPKLILYLVSSSPLSSVVNRTTTATAAEEKGEDRDEGEGTAPNSTPSKSKGSVVCKCMLMSNLPFPDFYVRWSHGMKLHYSLSDGRLVVHTSPSHSAVGDSSSSHASTGELYRWDQRGMADGTDWTISAPEPMKVHLLEAQKAMRRCLLEDSATPASSEPRVLTERIENLQ